MAKGGGRCSLSVYFGLVSLLFASVSLILNGRLIEQTSAALKEQAVAAASSKIPEPPLAGLSCARFGGPPDALAAEMIYWKDIPPDSLVQSPFYNPQRYLAFEPDHGGFNNIRMAMGTVLAMAYAMGRTLVLPPEKDMYLLGKKTSDGQRNKFSFHHFFPMQAIHEEHVGLNIITMEEFLSQHGVLDQEGKAVFPPKNRTAWDGAKANDLEGLFRWLRKVGKVTVWDPDECLAIFPASQHASSQHLKDMFEGIPESVRWEDYQGHPVPVNASTLDRMKENRADRKMACVYDETLQQAPLLHFPTDPTMNARLLVHFYAMVFFESWQQDLHLKRFVRDHVRYSDEIQCAAARVVVAIRERARQFQSFNTNGTFHTLHVRRGDFQYKKTRVEAPELLAMMQRKIPEGSTVYIATDEKDRRFFHPIKKHYNLLFMGDFKKEIGSLNTNYYGMVDQLIASRGEVFYGCWFSTFTGYIMRLRGYHADNQKLPGYEDGISNSWFYALPDRFDHMQEYYPVKRSFYAREFPTSWRMIDTGV